MQYTFAIFALAAIVTAQSATIPACANDCIKNGLAGLSNCNLDPACICGSASFIDAISCCVSKACDKAGQQQALDYARTICTPAGVTNLPTAASCAATGSSSIGTSATAGAATGSAASSASGASSAVTSAGSSASASASSATGSVAQSASSAVSSLSQSAASATSSASEAAGSSSSSAAAAATSGGAANYVQVQGVGAVGAGLLGLAAML